MESSPHITITLSTGETVTPAPGESLQSVRNLIINARASGDPMIRVTDSLGNARWIAIDHIVEMVGPAGE